MSGTNDESATDDTPGSARTRIFELFVELRRARPVVARERRVEIDEQEALGPEARPLAQLGAERLVEEHADRHEGERQRHLSDDERVTAPEPAARVRSRCRCAACPTSRQRAPSGTPESGRRERARGRHRHGDGDHRRSVWKSTRTPMSEMIVRCWNRRITRERGDAGEAAGRRDEQRLGEQLTDEAQAAGAHGHPHGDLPGRAGARLVSSPATLAHATSSTTSAIVSIIADDRDRVAAFDLPGLEVRAQDQPAVPLVGRMRLLPGLANLPDLGACLRQRSRPGAAAP